MPRMYLSARGEVVDFDAAMIKQQLAAAPMTVAVEQRKSFVDSKEVRKKPEAQAEVVPVSAVVPEPDTFEVAEEPVVAPVSKKK